MRIVDLKQKNNSRNVVVPRQIAMYLAGKQMTEASLPEIGRQFMVSATSYIWYVPRSPLEGAFVDVIQTATADSRPSARALAVRSSSVIWDASW